jgi:hypothetical protein
MPSRSISHERKIPPVENGPLLPFASWPDAAMQLSHCRHSLRPQNCLCGESTDRGLSGLMQVQLLLVQHLLAVAVGFMLRCSPRRGSGHSMLPVSADSKLTFRRTMFEFTDCGQSGLSQRLRQ